MSLFLLRLLRCFPLLPLVFYGTNSAQSPYKTVQHLQTNNVSNQSESEQPEFLLLCTDGNRPLLEGEKEVFSCKEIGKCPAGFECELGLNRPGRDSGICCPDLGELYKLYHEEEKAASEEDGNNEETEGGEQSSREEGGERADGQGADHQKQPDTGIDAMALLEQHYGDKIARRPHPRIRSAAVEVEPAALVHSPPVEIRRSPTRWHKQSAALNDANIWLPKARASKISSARAKVDASGEEYSCRKQRLELFCEDGRRRTQFVMRWYAKAGVCYPFPWGYCPGEPVASDRTIRTKAECELLCTERATNSGKKSALKDAFTETIEEKNTARSPSASATGDAQKAGQKSVDGKKQSKTTLEEEKGEEQRENEGPFASGAPNQEVGGADDQSIPEPVDLNQPADAGLAFSPLPSSSAELAEFLLTEQHPPKRDRCQKVAPYRAYCPQEGMPSQFTLRWYRRGPVCFAYPYGHCNGEMAMGIEEEPIKTERECLAICVKGQRAKNLGLKSSANAAILPRT